MAKHQVVEADPKEIKRAQEMWQGFAKMTTYSVVGIIVILAGLGIVFIDW